MPPKIKKMLKNNKTREEFLFLLKDHQVKDNKSIYANDLSNCKVTKNKHIKKIIKYFEKTGEFKTTTDFIDYFNLKSYSSLEDIRKHIKYKK